MKKVFLFLLFQTFVIIEVYSQVRADICTPKGDNVEAYKRSEWSDYYRGYWDNYYSNLYPNATKINTYGGYSSTLKFNCHGYAWHVSERELSDTADYRWIGLYQDSDEDIYWTSGSYTEISSPVKGGKVSYVSVDHSAIIADPSVYGTGWFVSKWGDGPLMRHAYNYSPYTSTNLKYYKLNPHDITGDINPPLCNNAIRTFKTDINHMPQALYWTQDGHIAYDSKTDSTYTVKGSGVGTANVYLTINTQSGFTWSSNPKTFQAIDKPLISNQMVDGSTYIYGMKISTGSHWLTFVPYPNYGSISDTWTVPSGIQYTIDQGNHRLGFLFPYNLSNVTFTVKATNTCGTGPISSYYLTRQRGLSGLSGMTLYPNPASDNVTVTMMENIPLIEYSDTTGITSLAMTDSKAIEVTTYTIRIYNSQSALLSTCKRGGKSFNIPLINMKDGTYIIEVNDGEKSYHQQLIVKHN